MSNKTPEKPAAATASARNPFRLYIGIALVFFGVLALVGGIIGLTDNRQRLIAPKGIITVEVVDTPETRQQGLSNRASLGDDEGMLFVFDDVSSNHCFWMKDMQFPIDMVWLDEEKRVINTFEFVEPSTYPQTFCPEGPAKYGLELYGYRAAEIGIVAGAQLRF